jgi:3-phenylpropionate/trans-cinnamate dioxygenase ferredoxin subunit
LNLNRRELSNHDLIDLEGAAMRKKVGSATAVGPGRIKAFDVGATAVAVANAGGHLYAFDDTCTHAGCSLADGDLEGTVVECACHGSRYDITTGAVIRGPAPKPIHVHPVAIEGPDLFVEA